MLILEKAERCVRGGLLKCAEDVFFLEPEELLALDGNAISGERIAALITERKAVFSKLNQLSPPELVTGEGSAVASGNHGHDVMRGIGCSSGMVSGNARVILDIADAHLLRPGEILVTKSTDPGWTPMFLICKAVVTEAGGILSHGATVAREYGVPCVASLKDATRNVCTGDLIQVDGSIGEVVLLVRADKAQ